MKLSILDGARRVVYVNTDTGSDSTGTGIASRPYRTPMRAVLDAPQFVVNGGSWVCRIEGSTPISISETWAPPPMIGDNTFSRPPTPIGPEIERNYNFVAVMGSVGTVSDADSDVSGQGPGQTFIVVNSGPFSPIPGNLTGKVVRDSNGSLTSIIANDTSIISVPMDDAELVAPFEVLSQGCTIALSGTAPVLRLGPQHNGVLFWGLHLTNNETITYPHNGVAHLLGGGNVSFVACNIKGLNTSSAHHAYWYACFLGGVSDPTNITIDGGQFDFYRCVEWSTAFDQFRMNDYRHIWCYINNSDRVGHTQGAGSFGTFTITQCKIVNPPGEASIAHYGGAQSFVGTCKLGGNAHGVAAFLPGQLIVNACDFADVEATIAALAVNGGQVLLNGPTGMSGKHVAADQQQQVDPATSVSASVNGTPGSTTYSFRVLTISTNGSKSKDRGGDDRLTGFLVTNAPDTITSSNNITITWIDGVAEDIDHYEVWRGQDQGTTWYKLGNVDPGVQTFLYDDSVTPAFGFYPRHDSISYDDWVAMGRDTDNAPYSAGTVRSRVVQMDTP